MKIRFQFRLTMFFSVVILLAVTISIFFTNRRVEDLQKEETIAHDVELVTRDLSYLSNDYLINREISQRLRWEARLASFSNFLNAMKTDDPEQQALINALKDSQHRLKSLFGDIVSNLANISPSKGIDAEMASIRVSWSRLEVENQRMGFEASRLVQLLEEKVTRMRETNIVLIFFLISIFSVVLVFEYWMVQQRILKGISQLKAGTDIIGSGNLDFSLNTNARDEIGELARAFNRMTGNLKTVAKDLLKAQEEVARAKRLSDIGALAASVAHELRNPLAAINIAVSNIQRKAQNPLLERHLENIAKKVLESDRIIDNLLFYSRVKILHYDNVNINEIIDECIDSAKTLSHNRGKISVTKDINSTNGVLIEADSLQIKETILNILNNSYDAVSESGGEIEISTFNQDNYIEIKIKDNGKGIAPQNLERVFEPFFTTKAKGTGLGLAVCRLIVDQHGGKIRIESAPNLGTAILITLPKKKI